MKLPQRPTDPEAAEMLAEAVWLVDHGACTPMCLLATTEDTECHCRCREERHGWLRRADAGVLELIPLAELLPDMCGSDHDVNHTPYMIKRMGAGFVGMYRCEEKRRRWTCHWGSPRAIAGLHGIRISEIDMRGIR